MQPFAAVVCVLAQRHLQKNIYSIKTTRCNELKIATVVGVLAQRHQQQNIYSIKTTHCNELKIENYGVNYCKIIPRSIHNCHLN
jgi:hypothetical protein